MLIFSRRTLQSVIDTVSGHTPDSQLRSLINAVEKPNKNGIPGVWELYLLAGHILAHNAKVEPTLANGKKPVAMARDLPGLTPSETKTAAAAS
ncbi:hypothetical protein NKH54_26555 [Mesorhizobium sp. M1004]|uniref:hypothetical protein n=1 Tax=Mesorhizobium sp. M1004 TaxID=2957046 RepID=UPI00333A8635